MIWAALAGVLGALAGRAWGLPGVPAYAIGMACAVVAYAIWVRRRGDSQ